MKSWIRIFFNEDWNWQLSIYLWLLVVEMPTISILLSYCRILPTGCKNAHSFPVTFTAIAILPWNMIRSKNYRNVLLNVELLTGVFSIRIAPSTVKSTWIPLLIIKLIIPADVTTADVDPSSNESNVHRSYDWKRKNCKKTSLIDVKLTGKLPTGIDLAGLDLLGYVGSGEFK